LPCVKALRHGYIEAKSHILDSVVTRRCVVKLYTLATLFLEKGIQYPLGRTLAGFRSRLNAVAKKEGSFLCWESNLGRSVPFTFVRFYVLTAAKTKVSACMAPCSLVKIDRHFIVAYCLLHQGDEGFFFVKAVHISKTSVYFCDTKRCHNREGCRLQFLAGLALLMK
jgi:hypothetical protein